MDFPSMDNMPDTIKGLVNGIPFLAGTVKDLETPAYTKLMQSVITFIVIGIIGWSASLVLENKENTAKVLQEIALANQRLLWMQETVLKNSAQIEALKGATGDRVFRPEWQQKYQEQDRRLLHLERYIPHKVDNE